MAASKVKTTLNRIRRNPPARQPVTGRRAANNRIRGPQSALTDFLASNNISAAQISADYERRQREAQRQAEQEAAANGEQLQLDDEEAREDTEEEHVASAAQKKKRKRVQEQIVSKTKASKDQKRQKKGKGGDPEGEDDDGSWNMYSKKKPLPGQLENCELCDKRFTVTAYSKTGPEGGLLCTKCSKEQEAQKKKDQKPKKQQVNREKRRQTQSNLLDGIVQIGSKSLQELCIQEVANNIHDVEEFGDLPQVLLNRLSQILSKRRVITSRTVDLFLRPNLDTIDIYDCGKLESEDYVRLFFVVPRVQNLNLRNAGQFKDHVLDYIVERGVPLRSLQLEAANLVSNKKWAFFFETCGHRLETLKLSWLDYSLDDDVFMSLVRHCPNLKRLKLKKCFRLGDAALSAMTELKHLRHLSLNFSSNTSSGPLAELITATGSELQTLSLENFTEADDDVLSKVHTSCTQLTKLRFTNNDMCTDAGLTGLFADWSNIPLTWIDLSSNRSLDYAAPDGPEEPMGLASAGFQALIKHSGSRLEHLDISSCRHINYEGFSKIFDGKNQYPLLRDINLSFLTKIDNAVMVGLFKSCPSLVKVTAFGCFNICGVPVPRGVALIGVPNAQNSIIQEGELDVDLC
ncbi:UV-damaged DNA-binding protein rad7 [Lecanora helva]